MLFTIDAAFISKRKYTDLNVIPDNTKNFWMFFDTGTLKNHAIFTGKYLCWSLFLIKLQYWAFFLLNTCGGWIILSLESSTAWLLLFFAKTIFLHSTCWGNILNPEFKIFAKIEFLIKVFPCWNVQLLIEKISSITHEDSQSMDTRFILTNHLFEVNKIFPQCDMF